MQKLKNYWRREPVLCIAVILAAVSSLYSRPQLAYIDFDVLAILLSLMLVVAELKEIRFLDWLAVELQQMPQQASAGAGAVGSYLYQLDVRDE